MNPIPYQISLQIMARSLYGFGPMEWMHNCGGSIVSERYVVSAAHCLDGIDASRLSVISGTNDLRNNGSKGTRHMVSWFKIHPDYIELNRSDIGIIKVAEPFTFGTREQPITYSDKQVGGGVECLLTGWGYTMPVRIGKTPEDLQEAQLRTITNDECRNRGFPVNPTEICTFTRLGQGACGVNRKSNWMFNDEMKHFIIYRETLVDRWFAMTNLSVWCPTELDSAVLDRRMSSRGFLSLNHGLMRTRSSMSAMERLELWS